MNRLRHANQDNRRDMATQFAERIARTNPSWDHGQVWNAAYKEADQILKRRRNGGK